ncbi:beta-ketoacyl synthase N-terminal-like domain-containing protein [Deltaproteobacteria bacterium TL4]
MDHEETRNSGLESIAVIGMAGRFPGARNLEEFWKNIRDGVESITFFSDEEALASGVDPELLKNPKFVKAHGVLDDIEMFDAGFFDMSPREARILDPQHRLFLECAWEAMENAGYDSETYAGQIGVYAGTSFSTYLLRNILPNNLINFPTADRLEMALTNHKDTMPMRVSFQMNLTGPSISVGTTCSTSLVAVHLACQSLLCYQSDMALAGASFARTPSKEGYLYQEGMIYSPDGHLRTFDADSKGIVTGAGVGVLLLKRLEDAIADGDSIDAIIKATALNNDGSTKIGYTAPSIEGQATVIANAISLAGIASNTISYIEAHGTGTELGDPVEIAALTKAFQATASDTQPLKNNFCAIASTKPNIGHLNHASGIASLIKTILALKHKQLPPSINFKKPNPKIDFDNSPFYVNTTLQEWKTKGIPRRAGVNAFGIGGTNGHVTLEEAPACPPSEQSRAWQLLLLSGKTSTSIETITTNFSEYLKQSSELNLADAAYTLQVGRKPFNHRRMLVCQEVKDAELMLNTLAPQRVFSAKIHQSVTPSVVFMFSGQGAQYVNMALELYQAEAIFKEQVDLCAEILLPHLELDLRDLLYPRAEKAESAAQALQQTAITQPALFVIEYALAKLWMAWGVHPQAMIGHSIGEYVAACLAEVFSLEEALSLVTDRGKLMQQMPPGEMLAVPLSPQALQHFLGNGLSLAVINGAAQCVVAGEPKAIEGLEQQLTKKEITSRRVQTSHAFHSEMMEPIVETFAERVKQMKLKPPQLRYISNVTGTWITEAEATDPHYWATHLRQTVRFAEGLEVLFRTPEHLLLEVGPGRTLNTLAKQHPNKATEQVVLTSVRHPQENQSDVAFLLTTLGKLWLAGVKIDWSGFYAQEQRQRLHLPTTPFERKRYWIDAPQRGTNQPQLSLAMLGQLTGDAESSADSAVTLSSEATPRTPKEQKIAAVWKNIFGIKEVGIYDNFFDIGGDSLLASHLVAQLCKTLETELSLQSFLNAPTIAELAEIIETSVSASPTTPAMPLSLVRLKTGDKRKKPLFLAPPIDGQVFIYQELVRGLDPDRPVYGFQTPGLTEETKPLTQISEMAIHYLEAMRTVQANGPYLLGGFSFGGLVAFEMSQQLQAQGQEVKFLFLADTPLNQALFNLEDETDILFFIIEHLLKLDKSAIAIDELRGLSVDKQINLFLTRYSGQLPSHLGLSQMRQQVQVIKANNAAMLNYIPRPYSGRLVFFRAQESWKPDLTYHPEHFWIELAAGGIEINTVPGNHLTMNNQPQVQVIIDQLERGLKQV